ncbi:ABC transporter permease [Aphanothece hegewaldii CCALA 016]|uniref:ABC transporter permease n=1 Tax=Aphanothece hegewaldii CCALA 016 TaxID=2107694 RepID=A0A2T1M3U0_9CHRO|nr:ABC transporter permease [Aphanothece hegewaldii]PSF39420.1 ABC transporter permease [Aphanothece hegewaldii CCALA 016]
MFLYNILAIFRKEFLSYFSSPITYIIMGIFWLIAGFFFNSLLFSIILDVAYQEQSGVMLSRDIAYEFLNSFWGVIVFSLLLVILPALSMGLYAEERKLGTLELLATSPLTNWGVAVGKLLGVITFFTVMIIPFWIYEIIIYSAASPPIQIKAILLAHIGIILLAAAILSIGMFISSLTDSSILAYIITFILVLAIWLLDLIGDSAERFFRDRIGGDSAERIGFFLKEGLSHLSWFEPYNNFIKGVFDSSSIGLFLSYIILGIFLTAQSIEALRFQQK